MARPSIYTQELANLICERVATTTFGLKKLCDMHDDMPSHDTVFKWRYKIKSFSDQYTQAKMAQAELLAEETLDIADDATNDWMEKLDEEGKPIGWIVNGDHINRSRLRVDLRKWHASKLAPKIYGDQKDANNTGQALSLAEQILAHKKEQSNKEKA